MRRRIDPLYLASAALAIFTVIVLIATTTGPSTTTTRTGSIYDGGPGGATALRRYLEAMGATTNVIQGDAFDPGAAKVLLLLGASELVTDGDTARIQAFVRGGGIAIVATDVGLLERSLFSAFNVRVTGIARPGALSLTAGAFLDPPASPMQIDRGVALVADHADVLATDGQASVIVSVSDGTGLFIVVGSLWPFLGSGIAQAENGRAILALARPALDRGVVAFDEYHHGAHPSADVLVLVEQTWPGRALVFVAALTLLYLLLSGRRLGPPLPLEVRPARSSLEYIRGFAGLVRRSGRGEIARRRLRADLQHGLARELGLDPATPFDRVLATIGAQDRTRAAEARALDDALTRPLREEQLLRTVAKIEELIGRRS